MKTWQEMEPRERDAWIAEHVMGFVAYYGLDAYDGKQDTHSPYCLWGTPEYIASWSDMFGESSAPNGCEPTYASLPHYTTDPAADYSVLEKVRDTWGDSTGFQTDRFIECLEFIWGMTHWGEANPIAYQPGDYSHAAFLAMKGDWE